MFSGISYPRASWLFVLLLLWCTTAWAQQDSGGIVITATDQTAATLSGAIVTLVNNGTNATVQVTTNTIGTAFVTPLPVGDYRITVEKP